MNIKAILLLTVFLLIGSGGAYAANGNMTVSGTVSAQTVSVGAGGVTFPDGSIQTNASRLVWERTVTGPAVSHVSTADNGVVLDGDADGGYDLEFVIATYGTSTQDCVYSIYFNNDTTATDYARSKNFGDVVKDAVFWDSRTSGVADRAIGAIVVAPVNATATAHIFNSTVGDGSSKPYVPASYFTVTSSPGNLTRIDIVGNYINTGSTFRLWKKK